MITLKVKDRGRDVSVHHLERQEEAEEFRKVYESLGYPPEKISIEVTKHAAQRAA